MAVSPPCPRKTIGGQFTFEFSDARTHLVQKLTMACWAAVDPLPTGFQEGLEIFDHNAVDPLLITTSPEQE